MGKILRLEEVPLNEPLPDSLYDCDGVLLMRRGTTMTSDKLKALALKGLRYLELGAPADAVENAPTAVATLEAPDNAPVESWQPAPASVESVSQPLPKVPNIKPIDPATTARVDQLVARASETVEELGKSLADGTLRDATPIRNVAGEFLKELQGDADQTIAATLRQVADQQLAMRSVQLSVLSIAIARAMKMTDAEQATVGSAALLHDMALFELPENERFARAMMRPESRRIYESHPAIAYDMLERVRDIDGTVRIIVLQAHEQADGSGFPRRITITRTHRLARVVNLADAYLTLVGCGPDGQSILPADAIAYLMHQSCLGRFDSAATCGLVRAVSLYPVGSLVMLSDDRRARVVRVADRSPVAPVVTLVDTETPTPMIDLAATEVTVAKPIDEDDFGRRRLPASDLDKILW
jgi:HD-GYP domain-containing protein (c-di-GMP phosphodiesterase class II)